MPFSREIEHVDPESIIVDREQRQRQQNLQIGDLIPSVRQRGIMTPLLINEHNELMAGERRLLTAKFLKMTEVPVRRGHDLTEADMQVIELEENLKRSDLTWQDKAKAILKVHSIYLGEDEDWTVGKTAQILGLNEDHTYRMIDLGERIVEGDESILKAETIANATTILTRRRARASDEAINRIMSLENDDEEDDFEDEPLGEDEEASAIFDALVPGAGGDAADGSADEADAVEPAPAKPARPARVKAPPFEIVQADAHAWMQSYEGPRFNFLHCDFPYGVELHGQAQQANFEGGGYESNPDIYWALCESLCKNWQRIMYPSSHVMFWIAMKFREETINFFEKHGPADLRIDPNMLIWHKTDNRGIIADAMRGPRNIGEYALMMSTGDRHIAKPVSNIYGAPTAKGESIHTNEKPEPMLRHFFSMFVDHHSRVLDPTAGSGSSIRTAESLGAEAGLGLEFNPEFARRAQDKLIQVRGLKTLSSSANSPVDSEEGE